MSAISSSSSSSSVQNGLHEAPVSKVPKHLQTFVKELPDDKIVTLLSSFGPDKWAKLLARSDSQGEHMAIVLRAIASDPKNREVSELNELAEEIERTLSKFEKSDFSAKAHELYTESKLLFEAPAVPDQKSLVITLQEGALQAISLRFQAILELDISSSEVNDQDFKYIQNFKQLEKLNLSRCQNLTWMAFAAAIYCNIVPTTLQEWEVEDTNFDDRALELANSKLVNLRRLNLSSCKSLNFEPKALNFSPKLEELILTETPIVGEVLSNIVKKATNLHVLVLSGCMGRESEAGEDGFTDVTPGLKAEDFMIDFPKSLRTLDVSLTLIDDQGLQKQLQELTNLQKIQLTGCRAITSSGLSKCSIQPALQELNLIDTNVNQRTREELKSKFQHLQVLFHQ